jgi:hypothetical protein
VPYQGNLLKGNIVTIGSTKLRLEDWKVALSQKGFSFWSHIQKVVSNHYSEHYAPKEKLLRIE